MGYTNKTSHYELPQYVANDKPSWLGDFNSAMLKIDTVMADNDATAEAANSAATGAQTQVAALSSQLSTIQGQVNTAVDTATTADGKATTAQSVATQASTTAGEAKTLAETAKQSADLALPIGGGTMTGALILNGAPTADLQAATKAYVDANSGGTSENIVLTKGANIASGTTNWKTQARKQGKMWFVNLGSVGVASSRTPLDSLYTTWYPLCQLSPDDIFNASASAVGNVGGFYVGTTREVNSGNGYPLCVHYDATNGTVLCVKIPAETSGYVSIGSICFTAMEEI